MTDFIQFMEEMDKGLIELTCVGMVNILKYIPGVQGVDEEVHIRPFSCLLISDVFRTQKMCNETLDENPAAFIVVPDCFKTQEMCNKVVNDCP